MLFPSDSHGFDPEHVLMQYFLVSDNSASLGHFSLRRKQGELIY